MDNQNTIASAVDHGPAFRSWFIPEYTQHERGRGWYAVAALVALGLIASDGDHIACSPLGNAGTAHGFYL